MVDLNDDIFLDDNLGFDEDFSALEEDFDKVEFDEEKLLELIFFEEFITYKFKNLYDFVTNFVLPFYNRPLDSQNVWCPKWFLHPEAVVRLTGIWQSFEIRNREFKEMYFLSNWILEHCDPLMHRLFDMNGPFKGCTSKGHSLHPLEGLPTMENK